MDFFVCLFYAVVLVGSIFLCLAAIDIVCLVILWRWRTVKRNEERRQGEKAERKKRQSLWDKEQGAAEHDRTMTEEELDRFYGAPW